MLLPGLWYNERAKGGRFSLAKEVMVRVSYEKRMRAAFLAIVILAAVVTAVFAVGAALAEWFIFP